MNRRDFKKQLHCLIVTETKWSPLHCCQFIQANVTPESQTGLYHSDKQQPASDSLFNASLEEMAGQVWNCSKYDSTEKGDKVRGGIKTYIRMVCFLLHFFPGLLRVLDLQWHPVIYLRENPIALCDSGTVVTTCHQNAEGCVREGFLLTSLHGSAFLRCSILSPEMLGSESLHSSNLKQALITNFHQGLQTLSCLYLASLI